MCCLFSYEWPFKIIWRVGGLSLKTFFQLYQLLHLTTISDLNKFPKSVSLKTSQRIIDKFSFPVTQFTLISVGRL